MRYMALPLIVLVLLSGCTQQQKEAEIHKDTIKKTVWTSKTELFMEYDEPKAGHKTGFLIHLTDLRDFKPAGEGPLILTFTPESGEPLRVKVDAPIKPGIYRTEIAFRSPGEYQLTAAFSGKGLSDELLVPEIDVTGGDRQHDHERHGENGGSGIAFLKEQQWTVDFMVAQPAKRPLSSSFIVTGELIPVSSAEVTVSSPLAGAPSVSKPLPYVGRKVSKGEVIAVLEPPVQQQGGIGQLSASHAEARNRLLLAQKEYERAKRLYESKAIAKKRVEEAELSLDSARAALEPLEKAMEQLKAGAGDNKILIRAPLSGTVVEVMAANGKSLEAGQPLVRIINTATLWLRANVPATEAGALKNLENATFTVTGIQGEIKPVRLVTVNDMVDTRSRTVPVLFEVHNDRNILKVGMFANVLIRTGHLENALTVPEEAVFEDEGRFFVFTQSAGDSFQRREVKLGLRGNGYVQVAQGIDEQERVVTRGGYYVRLASYSARAPQGHGHEH